MEIIDLYIVIPIVLAVIFTAFVALILLGFFRINSSKTEQLSKFTVLVPFKNEARIIRPFLNHLKKVLPTDSSVIIHFINDHSTDLTAELKEAIENESYCKLSTLPDNLHGKKNAVKYGVNHAKTSWILLLDIDTFPDIELFHPFGKFIPEGAKMVLIPLKPSPSNGFTGGFFNLDFLSLHFTGLATARLGIPVLSNAAALFIHREAYIKSCEIRVDWDEPSGDDIFAMMAIKKLFGSKAIAVLPKMNPLAKVDFPNGLSALWKQRLRWISKVGQVRNFWFQFFSWMVLLTQIMILFGYISIGFQSWNPFILIPISSIILSEIILLTFAALFAKRPKLLIYILPSVLIYPFYLFALVFVSAFKRPEWK